PAILAADCLYWSDWIRANWCIYPIFRYLSNELVPIITKHFITWICRVDTVAERTRREWCEIHSQDMATSRATLLNHTRNQGLILCCSWLLISVTCADDHGNKNSSIRTCIDHLVDQIT